MAYMATQKKICNWKDHKVVSSIGPDGFITTIHGGRIAPEVDPANISPDSVIKSNTLVRGPKACIRGKAVIENSLCQNATVEANSYVFDSVLLSTNKPSSHNCDAAGIDKVLGGKTVQIGQEAEILHSHIIDSKVGHNSHIARSTLRDCDIGSCNSFDTVRLDHVHSGKKVKIASPTEVSKAWLGRGTDISHQGYFSSVLSNEFHILDFDDETGRLSIKETIDIPHVSRYGTNTICSDNSGRLLLQPEGIMKDFGPQVKLWHDPLLSHESILMGPCCWVSPWTKVIGESGSAYANPQEVIEDRLYTNLMPFSASGYDGNGVLGTAFPGEANNGIGHKQRKGAWVFTHCPQAVINMVNRLHDALETEEKYKADIVVMASLNNALCLLKYWAFELGVDLTKSRDQQRGSRGKWFWDYKTSLNEHINSGIWKFKDGKPIGWIQKDSVWHHDKLEQICKTVSNDHAEDISEEELMAEPDEKIYRKINLKNAFEPEQIPCISQDNSYIDSSAQIHPTAIIDSAVQIGPEVQIGENTYIGPGTILSGKTVIGANCSLFRTILNNTKAGLNVRLKRCVVTGSEDCPSVLDDNIELTGCSVQSSKIAERTTGLDANVVNSELASDTTLSMFAEVRNTVSKKPMIVGTQMIDCRINTTLMTMHSAGLVSGLVAEPFAAVINGSKHDIPVVPMLGGGCQIQGKDDKPVVIEGAFIGSNAILEAGSFVGVGSFVLGKLNSDEGLLPFTVSSKPGPERDEIGGVLTKFSNLIITHIIGWTYQSLPKENINHIVYLINNAIDTGISAIEYEINRRQKNISLDTNGLFAKYKSLLLYTPQQLQEGLALYRENLDNGCWDLIFDGQNLAFANVKGYWHQRGGHVRWQKG